MPWLALDFNKEELDALAKEYGVRGIPALVVLKNDGKSVATDKARGDCADGILAMKGWLEKASSWWVWLF